MKSLQHTLFVLLLILLTSCGEDRTGEFYALIEDRMWIEETMREHYLWYDQIPAIEKEADYFKEASSFGEESELKIITKKPIVAENQELVINPRARSAKLRVAKRN